MRSIAYHQNAFEQFTDWAKTDRKLFERIRRLILDSAKDPFVGIGKPEPLKGDFRDYWSRRITDEHRLVYKVTDDMIVIASCKFHYTE